MRDLGEIVRVNAQAMRNADKHGMGRRPDPHKTHGDATSAQISARDKLIAAALDWNDWTSRDDVCRLAEAVAEYRKVHKM